jgi:hypothetical protein
VRYKARLDATALVGIGEIIVYSAPIYAIGEFVLSQRTRTAACPRR